MLRGRRRRPAETLLGIGSKANSIFSRPLGADDGALEVLILEFKVREVPAAYVLSVKGEIDLSTASEFHRELERVAQNGRHVVVDLSQVGFMDLRGVRIIEKFHNGMSKKSRRLVLCASSYPVHRILELAEVDKLISRFPTIEAALDSLESR